MSDQHSEKESEMSASDHILHIFDVRTAEMKANVSSDLFALEMRIGKSKVIEALVTALLVRSAGTSF